MVGVEIVVEGEGVEVAVEIAEQGAVAATAFEVAGAIEAFGNDGPLHGDSIGIGHGEGFVDAPGGGDVIEDDVGGEIDGEGVVLHDGAIVVAGAEAEIANDDVGSAGDVGLRSRRW